MLLKGEVTIKGCESLDNVATTPKRFDLSYGLSGFISTVTVG